MKRAFRVAAGRTVTLPQGLRAGPGRTNMRLEEGALVTLNLAGEAAQFGRFVNGRVTAGDLVEIDPATVRPDQDGVGAGVVHVGDPNRPGSGMTGLDMSKPEASGSFARKGR
jgi:hypothetical protein